MALAVSQDDSAALRMSTPAPADGRELPAAPVWFSIPASTLKSSDRMPAGARPFAEAMGQADSATLAFIPGGGRIAATLDIRCRKAADAAEIASRLTAATALLRDAMAKEHQQPDPAGLRGGLAAGVFCAAGPRGLRPRPTRKGVL